MIPRHAIDAARHARKRSALLSVLDTPWRRARWARHVSTAHGHHRSYPWGFVLVIGFLVATAGTAWAYFAATSTTHTYALAKADPLAAPIGVQATEVSTSSVDIDWTNPAEPAGTRYEVVRDPATTAITVCANAAAGPCLDTGLAAGTTYTYGVVAFLGTSWRSPMATVTYTTPPGTSASAATATQTGGGASSGPARTTTSASTTTTTTSPATSSTTTTTTSPATTTTATGQASPATSSTTTTSTTTTTPGTSGTSATSATSATAAIRAGATADT